MSSEEAIEFWSASGNTTDSTFFYRVKNSADTDLEDVTRSTHTTIKSVKVGDVYQGEFRISLPGTYKLKNGENSYEFSVQDYSRFPIAYELGATALAVCIFLSFVFVFKKKRISS